MAHMTVCHGTGVTPRGLEFSYSVMNARGLLAWCCSNRKLVPALEHYVSDARGRDTRALDLVHEAFQLEARNLTVLFLVSTTQHDPVLIETSQRRDIANIHRVKYDPATDKAVLGGAVYTNGKFRGHGLCSTTLRIVLSELAKMVGRAFTCHIGALNTNTRAIAAYRAAGAEIAERNAHSTTLHIRVPAPI